MRPSPTLIASAATIIFIGTLGLLLIVAGFGVIRIIEDMGEALGFIPSRWGENNPMVLVQIAAVISAPVVVWFSVWFFKKSRDAEIRLVGVDTKPRKPTAAS